jgi:hypothetical protein
MKYDVLWLSPDRMSYSCCAMMNEIFDNAGAVHHTDLGIDSRKEFPKLRGAVVCFHGGNEAAIGRGPALAAIMSAEVVNYDWVIFINFGDEAGEFPNHLIVHRNCKIYAQTPKPGTTHADRYMIEGYHAVTPKYAEQYRHLDRDLNWFFAGQVTHARREACARAIQAARVPFARKKTTQAGGVEFPITSIYIPTQSFGAGVSHDTYYEFMSRAQIVPCPSGPATPDSFRMCEALECGCVPILDACALDGIEGYWDMVFGPDHPFPVVTDWERDFPPLLEAILDNFAAEQRACQYFWRQYKMRFRSWLLKDMLSLGAI